MNAHPGSSLSFVLSFLVLVLTTSSAVAQLPDEVHVGTDVGIERFPLRITEFLGDAGPAELVREVLGGDLEHSGLFVVGASGPDAHELRGLVEKVGEKHVVTVSLREGDGGPVLLAKRWSGTQSSLRRIAHRIADAIIEVFTGEPGSFDSRIAYVSTLGRSSDVHVMDSDGARPLQVTHDGALVLSPEVSLDGKALYFTSFVDGLPGIYRIDRETGDVRRLLSQEGLNQAAAVSPDGGRLAFSASFQGNAEIYVSRLDGSGMRRLTENPAIDVSPAWSPSGAQVAFQSDRSGTPQVHLMSAEGLDVRRLTFEGGYNGEPAFSPDGTLLAFSSRRQGKFQVAILELATGRVQLVTSGHADHESPSWSPDGQFLAFASNRGGDWDIWSCRLDGSGLRRLGSGGSNRQPHWYR
ncbi:MAG: Tol-Pal system beta propeller repeat protein TolB [Acidobacteriota bacterium]